MLKSYLKTVAHQFCTAGEHLFSACIRARECSFNLEFNAIALVSGNSLVVMPINHIKYSVDSVM